jgi:putative ABC transport system permease protein
MRGCLQDLKFSLRVMRKSPVVSGLAVLCLALGIGVNTAVFSMLNFLFFRPLPVRAADRLVVLSHDGSPLISWQDYHGLRDRSLTLEGIAASNPTESSLEFDGETHTAAAEAVSLNYPRVIGVRPFLGRWFEREDEPSAVIGYRTWQRLFHGDPNILGKRIRSETQWYTIVGVAPEEFAGIYLPLNIDMWVPYQTWSKQYPDLGARVFVFGRMKAGIAPLQVDADLNALMTRIAKERPPSEKAGGRLVAEVVRGVPNPRSRQQSGPIAAVLMAVVATVLLIACVNVGNLLLARGAAREREFAMRIAIGARRARMIRQLLMESLVLAAGGGLAGFVLGAWTSRLLQVLLPTTAFGEALRLDLAPDARVTLFCASLALATTFIFGLAPAWRASRTDVSLAMKGSLGNRRFGLRRASLVAQVALSMVLLLTAGLFLRTLFAFQSADPGFAITNRLYVTALASPPEFSPESGLQFYARTLDRLRAMPGVKSAAITNLLPLTPINPDCASESGHDPIAATTSAVSPHYLETMRIPLMAGRDFSATDLPDSRPVGIINEALARQLWPKVSPIGKRLFLGCRQTHALEIVGVAHDARVVSLGEAPKPHIYRAFAQDSGGVQNIVVETAMDARAMLEPVRKLIVASGTGARIYGVRPLREWVDRSYWQVRWAASMLGAFGGLALVLAAVGLYGVVAYHVSLRTREIGVRMAVGAQPRDVVRLILWQGLGLTLGGAAIGWLLAAILARAMIRLLYGVSPTDLPTYAAVALIWLAVGLAACYTPARRASRVDPTAALRCE